jgi:hypothetical protein
MTAIGGKLELAVKLPPDRHSSSNTFEMATG